MSLLSQVPTVHVAARQTTPAPEAPIDHAAPLTTSVATLQLTVSPLMAAKLLTVNVPAGMGIIKSHQPLMDNAVVMLHVQAVLGMELAAASLDSAPTMLPTVRWKMVVRRAWGNALRNLQMVRVGAHTSTSSMSALGLSSESAARALASAVLTRSTVVCLVKANSDHAWHQARTGPVHGIEDIPV
jgi:hypothetical protein